LLELLTAGWQADDGRTVFVVGDPMQSIYRFRDAQVGLFLQARRAGLPNVKLEPLTLSTNFRSQGAIVDWVNSIFPTVLPSSEDEASGAVPYSPSVPFEAADAEGEPALELFSDREGEAKRVVELVAEARGKTSILVRNRSHLDHIVEALKGAGVRYRAVEIEQLGEKQVVQDLYALTRALTHLADRVAWLSILRAPWCGLTLAELSSFFEAERHATVWALIQSQPRLSRFVSTLRPACAAPCATAWKASGSRWAARPALSMPPTSRTPKSSSTSWSAWRKLGSSPTSACWPRASASSTPCPT
jgi:ATP-dependent exoDNAse (exonuclease V) beta subunit